MYRIVISIAAKFTNPAPHPAPEPAVSKPMPTGETVQ
jgi:hypothetical protein